MLWGLWSGGWLLGWRWFDAGKWGRRGESVELNEKTCALSFFSSVSRGGVVMRGLYVRLVCVVEVSAWSWDGVQERSTWWIDSYDEA